MSAESFFVDAKIGAECFRALEASLRQDTEEIKNSFWKRYKSLLYCYSEGVLCLKGCLINFFEGCADAFTVLRALVKDGAALQIGVCARKTFVFEERTSFSEFVRELSDVCAEKYSCFRETFGKFSLDADGFYKFRRKNGRYFRKDK